MKRQRRNVPSGTKMNSSITSEAKVPVSEASVRAFAKIPNEVLSYSVTLDNSFLNAMLNPIKSKELEPIIEHSSVIQLEPLDLSGLTDEQIEVPADAVSMSTQKSETIQEDVEVEIL